MTAKIRQAWEAGPTIETRLEERAAIRAALDGYGRGWFEADAELIDRVLHPLLAKFSVDADAQRSEGVVVLGRDQMVEAAARGAGVDRAGSGWIDVSILGASGSIACAEVRMEAYVEFALLVRDRGTWRIVSTAWRWADGAGPRAPG